MAKQPWIVTNTGKKFYPFNPRSCDVDIRDIAHTLSLQCRWNGHINRFYSVAQHSVMVSKIVEETQPEHALEGFCHDFGESYVGDLPSPIKAMLPDFKMMEERIERAISRKYGLRFPFHPSIKRADISALTTEAVHLFDQDAAWVAKFIYGINELDESQIRNDLWEDPWDPMEAEVRFYRRWTELMEKRND